MMRAWLEGLRCFRNAEQLCVTLKNVEVTNGLLWNLLNSLPGASKLQDLPLAVPCPYGPY